MVAWIENQKIREYKEEMRGSLCDEGISSVEWGLALQKYLDDLSLSHGLPTDLLASKTIQLVLQRLLNFAVQLKLRIYAL